MIISIKKGLLKVSNGFKLGLLLICISFLQSCLTEDNDNLQHALRLAGENRMELEKVLQNYSASRDLLKYKAACFLIGDMIGRKSRYVEWYDADGNLFYPEFNEPRNPEDFERKAYGYGWYSKEVTCDADLHIITSNYLIRHIDYAFEAWERPWAQHLSFDQFCEWLLPYRVGTEKLVLWQEVICNEFAYLEDSLKEVTCPEKAFDVIDRDFFKWFQYGECADLLSPWQDINEIINSKTGTCDDYCTARCFLMRSFGIPLMIDCAIRWGNRNGAHYEIALLDTSGMAIALFPLFEQVETGWRIGAKVWRKTYAIQESSLVLNVLEAHLIPEVFRDVRFVDASKDHAPVKDINIVIDNLTDTIAYMSVFNYGCWQPVWWGKKRGNEFCFTDMIPRVVYLPVAYHDGLINPVHVPVWLDETGVLHYLKPDLTHVQEVVIDTVKKVFIPGGLIEKQAYELFYWDQKHWHYVDEKTFDGNSLVFTKIPANALLRLKNQNNQKNDERIFISKDGKIEWF